MTIQYLLFAAPIDQQAVRLISGGLTDAISDQQMTEIYVGFSTTGGAVSEGIALHHIVRSSPKPVTIHGIGNVDSIGITILLGATNRYATPGTRFFFHPMGSQFQGSFSAPLLRTKLQSLLTDQARLGELYK